ncbi:tetratricopeptide repeat protein [Nocardia sp. CA-129566]|uniref:tetratricopeptide repeat protein n=1 Tax=Nocardia sp. CA-129566 TaxID=3239976 RepID=UPI003D970F6C
MTGDLATATADYQQVYDLRTRVLGADNPDTLRALGAPASCRADADDHEGAAADYQRLLDARTRVLGSEHEETLRTRGDLIYQQSRSIPDQQRTLG